MVQIIQKGSVAPQSARVILACAPEGREDVIPQLTEAGLTAGEAEYALKQYDAKKQCVSVPCMEAPVFVLFADMKKSPEARMEAIRRNAVRVQIGVNERKVKGLSVQDCTGDPMHVSALVEGLVLSDYQFLKYMSEKDELQHSLGEIVLVGDILPEPLAGRLRSLMLAVCAVRDMVNEPASYLTATKLAEHIAGMGADSGFGVEVLRKEQIEDLKMGGLLAVNSGSIEPPTFSVMSWKPQNARNEKPVVLVGKGLVFDTGGLCLKPAASMDEMKSDMSGGAAVAGVLYALALCQSPVYVIGLVPSTDNRLSGSSVTPGDVITMLDGTTVEIVNTDAEGRLLLADALTYAKQFEPQLVVDIATLTGSATAAIGELGVVAMGNAPRELMDQLKLSGEMTYERIAEFPFWDEYSEMIKSNIADLKNSGKRFAGAITAGKFLEHFTDYPYIHLDIAGPAFLSDGDGYRVRGGTGVGVRLLFDFIHRII